MFPVPREELGQFWPHGIRQRVEDGIVVGHVGHPLGNEGRALRPRLARVPLLPTLADVSNSAYQRHTGTSSTFAES
jgi:hypothetical protein